MFTSRCSKVSASPQMFFPQLFFLLTGSGRYIPGSGPNPGAPVGVADPFTGELLSIHYVTPVQWETHVHISPVC